MVNHSSSPTHGASLKHLEEYRNKLTEKERVSDLMSLVPNGLTSVVDIGARDGYISKELTKYFTFVTALDLERPTIEHPKVQCVKGDATLLEFSDNQFDLVFCAEVLEHIPSPALEKACLELQRITNRFVLIGVPYKQDTRHGRTTCYTCKGINPPWSHVNKFDEKRLAKLFGQMRIVKISFVGEAGQGTNFLSAYLLNIAGNPYGTYTQDEPCIHCGAKLIKPTERTFAQKIYTRIAYSVRKVQKPFHKKTANWIHILFEKI